MTTGRGAGRGRRKMASERVARAVIASLAAKRHEIRPGIGRLVFLIHRLAPASLAPMMRRA